MDNKIKRYLDRVVIELVRGTTIDYNNKVIKFSFSSAFSPLYLSTTSSFSPPPSFLTSINIQELSTFNSVISDFLRYCRNTFGLTEDEIDYVWKEYSNIIKDKIFNEES